VQPQLADWRIRQIRPGYAQSPQTGFPGTGRTQPRAADGQRSQEKGTAKLSTAKRHYQRELERIKQDARFTAYKAKAAGRDLTRDEYHSLEDAAAQVADLEQRLHDLNLNEEILAAQALPAPPMPATPAGA
jgi:hypothetical protein